jgi:hypothetical protein
MSTHHVTDQSDALLEPLTVHAKFYGEREPLNLNEILSERVALYERLCGPAITLIMRLANDLDPVFTPLIDLDRLLLNLVMNTRSCMPFGGRLELTTSNVASSVSSRKRSVRLQIAILRNSPENRQPVDHLRCWDPKLAQSLMQRLVSANRGILISCQPSELILTTEILLPSSNENGKKNLSRPHREFQTVKSDPEQ